jgi:Ca2+:H+ antiporter
MQDTLKKGRKANLYDRPPNDELINSNAYEDGEEAELHIYVALFTMAASTILIVACSKFMTSQLRNVTESGPISTEFLALIILPLAPNLMEFIMAIIVASKDKLNLALAVPLGRSIDSILFIFPIIVIVGWIIGNESMTLELGLFPSSVLILAAFMSQVTILSGKSNFSTGVQMIGAWSLFATCSWFYRDTK